MKETTVGAAIQARLRERLDHEVAGILTGATTSAAAQPGPTLNAEAFLRDMARLTRDWRRSNVTIAVVLGHIGPPTVTQHPTGGKFIECGYRHAAEMHRQVPLRLARIVSTDRAEFEVAGPFGYVPALLPAPPYEVPPHD